MLTEDCPLDYSLCCQTVTVYRREADGSYSRRVLENRAMLDYRQVRNTSRRGSKTAHGFLLVIPCSEPCLAVGDKVLPGVGPEISTREEWEAFIPARVEGLVVIGRVDPKFWMGRLIHMEGSAGT